ncbi:MAG: RDD family protein [Alphaproteobacteria bacterium]
MPSAAHSRSSNSSPDPITFNSSGKPHAYDPVSQSEYFEDVLGRRVMAFVIDFVIIFAISIAVNVLLFFAGIFTLGLAWLLFGVAFPAVALAYTAYTLSGPESATIGMRVMELQMRTWYGAPMYALLAAFHAIIFYMSATIFTPFILLVALFTRRKRCLHDFVAGTIVINTDSKAKSYKRT